MRYISAPKPSLSRVTDVPLLPHRSASDLCVDQIFNLSHVGMVRKKATVAAYELTIDIAGFIGGEKSGQSRYVLRFAQAWSQNMPAHDADKLRGVAF